MPDPMATRSLPPGTFRTRWNEPKRCRSLSLSDTAWAMLTELAETQDSNRSEVMERLIRQAITT